LILAAFLADNNPKSSDNLKFIGESKKRKHKDLSNSEEFNDGDEKKKGIKKANGLEIDKNAVSSVNMQLISIERLLSIYAQILYICEKHSNTNNNSGASSAPVTADYGRPQLQILLETLVEKGLLWKPPNWKIIRPFYGSSISKTLADDVGKSLGIDINTFLVNSNSCHFNW
jgi:hypothetical protein